jgi:hypothetical protein
MLLVAQGRVVREAFTAEGAARGVAMFERFPDSARGVLILATGGRPQL